MPEPTCSVADAAATPTATRHCRTTQVAHLDALVRSGDSQRAYARRVGLPSETLRDWVVRRDAADIDPQLALFFDSPAGLALLQRLFVAALLVMNLQGSCGLRLVGQFFAQAGLSPFLASSYGTLQQHSAPLHRLVADFGQQQSQELGKNMPQKAIVVCEDETFPASGMTLVAMEPLSGFLLAEQTAQDRTAKTWNTLFDTAIAPYNVDVIAQCSDEAPALRAHAEANGIPHCPDLFHVLHDINGALVLHLSRLSAEAAEGPSQQQVLLWQEARQTAVKTISDSYHPYDLCTGAAQSLSCVLLRIDTALCELEAVAVQSSAPSSSVQRLAKARRVVPAMVIAVADYHVRVQAAFDEAALPWELQQEIEQRALPAAYLRRVAHAQSSAESRQRLLQRAEQLAAGQDETSAVQTREEHKALSKWVEACAGWFCRGSSCVEGRNGVLSLRQHAHRRLLPQKRTALTVAHNFLSRRADGTTAAERFFEQPHPDLFLWVLQRMPVPPRPAASRAKSATSTVPVA